MNERTWRTDKVKYRVAALLKKMRGRGGKSKEFGNESFFASSKTRGL